ncbi:MAG TPA: F0F1 ATP synthase subunit B [Longimicrobiaceae bacterium]|nr:F0F1 ATP synthase subunit B [Longimicrobiaceae bacterium]
MIAKLLRTLPLLLVTATPLYAQEAGPLDVNVGLMIWTVIIFVIVLVVLGKFAWPHILGAVEAREQHIRDLIASSEADRAAAAAALHEQQRLLDETRARVQDALGEARGTGERMREEMMASARREHEELMTRARRDIESERQNAVDSVRREAVDLAIAAAEKLVRRSMDTEDNRRLVLEYLAQVQVQRAPATAGA